MLDPAQTRPKISLQPKKLLRSKWTAVAPLAKEKHFLVTGVVVPEDPLLPIEWIDLEAVYSGAVRRLRWRDLTDQRVWMQGWR